MALIQDWRAPLGTVHTDEALSVVVDHDDNIIVAGYTTGEFVRGAAQGGYDAWIVKLAANGTEHWRHQIGTKSTDQALAVAVDAHNNIAIAGYTTGELVEEEAYGGYDAWVAKFAPDGTEHWRHQIGTPAEDTAYGVTFDGDGNVIVVGYTAGDMLQDANAGGFDAWVAKFDKNGSELWRRQLGTEADDDAQDVVADSRGHLIVVGYTSGAMVADEHIGGFDGWVAKFAPDGSEQWRRQVGSVMGDRIYSVTVDSEDYILVTGHTAGEMVKGEAKGGYDAWVAKFTPDGEEVWRHQAGTSSNDDARGIAVDAHNDVIIVGYTFSRDTSHANAWVVKFKADGGELWRERLKAIDDEAAHGVAISRDGSLIIAGYTTRRDSPFTSAWLAKFHEEG